MTPEQFNLFNFNGVSNFIKTQRHTEKNPDYLYLTCHNNDPINDFLINLVLQKIANTDPLNMINYHNFYVGNFNGNFYYSIIMDKLEGSLDYYLLSRQFTELEQSKKDEIVLDILKQTELLFEKVKNRAYLFSHTDMKCENLFYRMEDDKPIIYLGDFDKSSITYKGIRFYCESKNGDAHSAFINFVKGDESIISAQISRSQAVLNNLKYSYRISRLFRNLQLRQQTFNDIEFEQLYMRYNFTPYYMSFDMITLIMSLILYKLSLKQQNIISFITEYCSPQTLDKLVEYIRPIPIEDVEGNFGKLLQILMRRIDLENILFIENYGLNNDENYDFLPIDKLFITTKAKIALSFPFIPNPSQVSTLDGKILSRYTVDKDNELNQTTLINFFPEFHSIIDYFSVEYNNDFPPKQKSLMPVSSGFFGTVLKLAGSAVSYTANTVKKRLVIYYRQRNI